MIRTLGDYNLLERIGAGGLGEIYRARDTRRGRTVALQIVSPAVKADPPRRAKLIEDARVAETLSHPNIAALYEIGDVDGELFLVCEYVPGETLRQMIGGRAVNTRHALDIAIQVADALADAHAADVVHCNLNTETIFVTPKGNAKIVGFGLSAWNARDLPGYQSPEQGLGEPIDFRTDLYSLGTVLFEMLTGRPPFRAPTPDELPTRIAEAAVPPPSGVNPSLPRELDPIVSKAMSRSLDRRTESAALLAAELRTIAAILDVRSAAAEAVNPPQAAAQRSFAGWILLLAALAIVGAALWWRSGG